MASRVIYDSFLTSKSVARLTPYYQDQFHRWLHLPDDWGCFNADPDVIKGICYCKRKQETRKKIIQIRRALCRNGDLFVWKDDRGRDWAYFVRFGLHNKFCTASTVDKKGNYTKHRRKTPEPPPKLVKLYLARIPTSSDKLRHVATKSSYPIPDPIPIPIPKDIYVHWNSLKIRVHQKLTPDMSQAIKKALGNYEPEQITKAMTVYSGVLKSKETYWNYKWGLIEFCQRGLKKFVDMSVEDGIANFKQKKTRGDLTDVSTEWKPGKGKM